MQNQKTEHEDVVRESLIGLFALHMMQQGPVYGSDITNKINELTEGTWKPGAGAIYPTLSRLVRRGYAQIDLIDDRKKYRITSKGRSFLEEIKKRFLYKSKYTFTWRLVLEIVDPQIRSDFVIKRFKSGLETIEEILNEKGYLPAEKRSYLARTVIEEMQRSIKRINNIVEAIDRN